MENRKNNLTLDAAAKRILDNRYFKWDKLDISYQALTVRLKAGNFKTTLWN